MADLRIWSRQADKDFGKTLPNLFGLGVRYKNSMGSLGSTMAVTPLQCLVYAVVGYFEINADQSCPLRTCDFKQK